MKKLVLILLCLFVIPFHSPAEDLEEPEKEQITIVGELDLPEKTESGEYSGMETDIITDTGKCYSIANTNKEAMKQVEKYCTPKCKMTAVIIMNTYIHEIIEIETAE